jgi:hypothetical protein
VFDSQFGVETHQEREHQEQPFFEGLVIEGQTFWRGQDLQVLADGLTDFVVADRVFLVKEDYWRLGRR